MLEIRAEQSLQVTEGEWITFRGGELQGKRPNVLCAACRSKQPVADQHDGHESDGPRPALCFQCYRVSLDRGRALKRAADLDTASSERFQATLPFEPVNRPRLERLRSNRTASRIA